MRDDDEYDDRGNDEPRGIPGSVLTAGIIWIGFGLLGILSIVLQLALSGAAAAQGGGQGGGQGGNPGATTGPCCGFSIALGFLIVGYQTVTGKAKDTLGNAIGSICIGVIYIALGVFIGFFLAGLRGGAGGPAAGPVAEPVGLIIFGIMSVFGTVLILAGTLALVGRVRYRAWRLATGLADAPRRRRRRDDDDRDRDE